MEWKDFRNGSARLMLPEGALPAKYAAGAVEGRLKGADELSPLRGSYENTLHVGGGTGLRMNLPNKIPPMKHPQKARCTAFRHYC